MPYITAFCGLWAELIISMWSPCEPMHWQSPELLSGSIFHQWEGRLSVPTGSGSLDNSSRFSEYSFYYSGLIQLGQGLVNIHIGNVLNRLYSSGWIDLKKMFSFQDMLPHFHHSQFCCRAQSFVMCAKISFQRGCLLCVSQYVSNWEDQCCYMNFSPYGYLSNPAHWMHIDGKVFQDKSEESSACSVYLFHKLHVLLYQEKNGF